MWMHINKKTKHLWTFPGSLFGNSTNEHLWAYDATLRHSGNYPFPCWLLSIYHNSLSAIWQEMFAPSKYFPCNSVVFHLHQQSSHVEVPHSLVVITYNLSLAGESCLREARWLLISIMQRSPSRSRRCRRAWKTSRYAPVSDWLNSQYLETISAFGKFNIANLAWFEMVQIGPAAHKQMQPTRSIPLTVSNLVLQKKM